LNVRLFFLYFLTKIVTNEEIEEAKNLHPSFFQKSEKFESKKASTTQSCVPCAQSSTPTSSTSSLTSSSSPSSSSSAPASSSSGGCSCPSASGSSAPSSGSSAASSSVPTSSSSAPTSGSSVPPVPTSSGSLPCCNSSSSNPCGGGGNPYDNGGDTSGNGGQPSSNSSGGNSPPTGGNANDSNGTGACNSDNKATNAVGKIGPKNFAITKAPYKVYSCDQVIVVSGETFSDPRDYSKRKPALFTLSVYMVNHFDSNDGKTMRGHLLVENVTDLPDVIMGAPTCLDFLDNKNMKRLVMCLPSQGIAHQIKEAYMSFLKCRMGDNLKALDSKEIKRVFQAACMGRTLDVPDLSGENKLMTFLKPFLPPMTNGPSAGQLKGINPAFGFRVPGSPIHHHSQQNNQGQPGYWFRINNH